MNWYAYKLLADGYAADRQRIAQGHRRARTAARRSGAPGLETGDAGHRHRWLRAPFTNRASTPGS